MLATLENILVGIDGADSATRAAYLAIEIAKSCDCNVIALNVVVSERGHSYPAGMFVPVTQSSISELLDSSQKQAQVLAKLIQTKASEAHVNLRVEVVATPTSIVRAIIDYAEKNAISLIVLGSRSRTGIAKRPPGSVASGVLAAANCPVMVVK